MIFPSLLKTGDRVAIVAPGKKINEDDVTFAAEVLRSWGLDVTLGKNLFVSDSYLSAPDHARLTDLQTVIDDTSIKGIFCARGGYGTTRILDDLDFTSLVKEPKWIAGFSDITALHLALFKNSLVSVHGTMPVLFKRNDSASSVNSLKDLLFTGGFTIRSQASEHNRIGSASGQLVGGNLSLLVDSLGTRSELETDGKILFIEEIDEYLYKIDRMLTQLKRADKLKNLSGLIVGHLTDINDTELPFGSSVFDIIKDAVKNYNYPVAFHFPSGHESPNFAWIHGAEIELRVAKDGTLAESNSAQTKYSMKA
jgi:muramoyltetrapeptide carboxypeptidase